MIQRRSSETPSGRGSTDDLRRISGIGSKVAGRLAEAGVRTNSDLVGRSPEELAGALDGLPGCSAGRIAALDWIGQARPLRRAASDPAPPRGTDATPAGPHAQDVGTPPPVLRVARVGSAHAGERRRGAGPGEPTAVALELRPGAGAAAAPALDGGLYRLVATIDAYPPGHATGAVPVWSATAPGELLEVEPGASPAIRDRLLADGVITAGEHADLAPAEPAGH